MADNIILDGLKAYGVKNAEDKAIVLESYLDQILLFNPALKLVGEKKREDIIYRHILDSASAYSVFASHTFPGCTIADLGTGAGLPGIVLSILFPDREFVLIDRMTRRIGFLRSVKGMLSLKNIEIESKDIGEVQEKFDFVTSRAFRPLDAVADDSVRLSHTAILYKGTLKNIKEELENLESSGFVFSSKIYPIIGIGEEGERNIVVLENWRKQ